MNKHESQSKKVWILNSSNEGKVKEFQRLFALHGQEVTITKFDLKEVQADPITVAVHKASQMEEGVLCEDTSLEVEGADVGINVRWLLSHLPDYIGHHATWKTLLAYRKGNLVRIYEGVVHGTIVAPSGIEGFGFDPVFLPDGAYATLAEVKPDHVNARAKAVEALINDHPYAVRSMILDWTGPWQ